MPSIQSVLFPAGKFSTAHAEAWLRYGELELDQRGDPMPRPPAGLPMLLRRRTLLRIDRLKKHHRLTFAS